MACLPSKSRQPEFLSTPSARRATQDKQNCQNDSFISIHALREEGDLALHDALHDVAIISIHALREEGDGAVHAALPLSEDFYPRPPRGGRPVVVLQHAGFHQFLSTPSARRATHLDVIRKSLFAISIHALREEGDPLRFCGSYLLSISIHALREEGDFGKDRDVAHYAVVISIHALREEGDVQNATRDIVDNQFLSTPSARRATSVTRSAPRRSTYFYPRPPRGGRREGGEYSRAGEWISIHALREEGDAAFAPGNGDFVIISIHALREEGDYGRFARQN